ncbi:CHAD domain-containing protein [Pararhizobium sp. LjRoot235]|uniref:CHAD domain-containing protein n=1 Tax=Pararhizobium sp. LjRoot235 TaxID=3342291 RepID=UPI003ECFE84E
MSYHIHPSETFTKEFRAVGSEQLELAIAALTERPKGLLEAIHDARKCFKRLRSLYRLAATAAPAFRQAENTRIREMAKTLSTFRDTTALVEVIQYLHHHAENNDEHAVLKRTDKILTARRDMLSADERPVEESVAKAIATCGQALEAISHVTFSDDGDKAAKHLAEGWCRMLKRAAAACEACGETTDAHVFHELRKRSQDYRYSLDLLQPLWPSAMHAKRVEATELVDLLGHHNDLALLSSLVNEQQDLFGRSEDLAHLLSVVISRQETLRTAIMRLAVSVFRDDPRDESRKIRLLWQAAA